MILEHWRYYERAKEQERRISGRNEEYARQTKEKHRTRSSKENQNLKNRKRNLIISGITLDTDDNIILKKNMEAS